MHGLCPVGLLLLRVEMHAPQCAGIASHLPTSAQRSITEAIPPPRGAVCPLFGEILHEMYHLTR